MRLADFVVSYCLQINNDCLRYLADNEFDVLDPRLASQGDRGETLTVYSENLLARETRRLASMWVLVDPAVTHTEDQTNGAGDIAAGASVDRHLQDLKLISNALAESASPARLALRLAGIAVDEDDAAAMLKLARALPQPTSFAWDELNHLFAEDSRLWRGGVDLRSMSDEQFAHRIARSYRKALKCSRVLERVDSRDWAAGQLARLNQWTELAAHQFELLRSGLSDKGKTRLWYIGKLSDSMRTRSGLLALRNTLGSPDVKKSVKKSGLALARRFVDQQIGKTDSRIQRLAHDGFKTKPKRMRRKIDEAVENVVESMDKRAVKLMPNPSPQWVEVG